MTFVRASRLYDVKSGERIQHPAHDATDSEVRQAVRETEV
jgi:hypothetical protein